MRPVIEKDIRRSFVNCSKGEAQRLNLPRDLADQPWDDLDFLGWRDPGAPDRAYIVTERDDGGLLGVTLRANPKSGRGFTHSSMCSLCMTAHTGGGVSLMTARRAGEAGRQGNSVGQYLCADLACSLYVRGRKQAIVGVQPFETSPVEEKIARARRNLATFVDSVLR
ncbi:FBP domain-containing protein [Jiangella alba]|uniref:FBP C-terminal treble-clef zinc-finger n=1 Tax=Jiangella alba TaxID=561176 RepID=A0A1H5JP16_9ACTN|nr:FBP domain-containing protein [Jiangella alba]SEE53967.1 FBP C-terminal treble-clef zinc-finger [Jiangella alba]